MRNVTRKQKEQEELKLKADNLPAILWVEMSSITDVQELMQWIHRHKTKYGLDVLIMMVLRCYKV